MENKNNVKKNPNSFKIPRVIITFGKVLQFFSKDLATLFVSNILSSPRKFTIPERELVMRESSKKERLSIPSIDADVQVYIYGYSKTKVLLVHGWAGRGTQLFQLADKILENKMMVVSFDAPGHGLSSGKRTNIFEFIETIKAIHKKYGPFDSAIGHSYGGMSLLNARAGHIKFDKLVTIGADNSLPLLFQDYVNKMELKPIIAHKLEKLFENKYDLKLDSFSSEQKAVYVNIPALVIHDSDDKFVNVSSALAIRQKLKQGELLITNGLGHHKIFKDKNVIQRIIEFIK